GRLLGRPSGTSPPKRREGIRRCARRPFFAVSLRQCSPLQSETVTTTVLPGCGHAVATFLGRLRGACVHRLPIHPAGPLLGSAPSHQPLACRGISVRRRVLG